MEAINLYKWEYHSPTFECDNENRYLLEYAPWSGHRNFGYDLVTWLKPTVIAELGSHYGCSTFAFSQAIKDNALITKMISIDSWEGDDFTENDYKESVKESVYEKFSSVLKNVMAK